MNMLKEFALIKNRGSDPLIRFFEDTSKITLSKHRYLIDSIAQNIANKSASEVNTTPEYERRLWEETRPWASHIIYEASLSFVELSQETPTLHLSIFHEGGFHLSGGNPSHSKSGETLKGGQPTYQVFSALAKVHNLPAQNRTHS